MNEKQEIGFQHGPGRVVINADGEAITPFRARQEHDVIPSIMFVRQDGWTLGAPQEFEEIAYRMWAEDWIGFTALPNKQFRSINQYRLRK
jgi:hypothetical protein